MIKIGLYWPFLGSKYVKSKGNHMAQRPNSLKQEDEVSVSVKVAQFENIQRCYQIQKLKSKIVLWMGHQMYT